MSSPFASQLGTNYCPRDEELPQIKALLIEPSQRLKRLDDEIAVLQKALDKLSKERDALSAYVEAHEVLMSPIRRLPLDILEHIFVACLPTHRNCVMSAQEAPVILGRICSYWRTISLATPRLWSRLHIVEPTGLEQPNSSNTLRRLQRLEVANLWLRRSGECPLSISLNPSPDPLIPGSSVMSSPGSTTNPALFLTALIQFAPRWQNIRLAAQLSALEALSRLTEDDVPLLKQLDIVCFADAQGTNDDQWTLSQCGVLHCPSLSAFSISGSFTPASELPLRWNQLTVLSLLCPPWGQAYVQTCGVVLKILSQCPKLRTCSVLVDPDAGPPPEEDRSIVECLFLHTLDLLCVDTPLHTSGYLLNRLSLPDLREFTLRGQATPGDSTGDSLLSSLAASSRLEIIHIESGSFTKSSLMEFFRGLSPTVQHLHITEPKQMPWQSYLHFALDDTVLATLASCCPTLRELVILNSHNVSDEGLLAFIISRPPGLRRIEAKFNREKQVDILPSLQSFATDCLESSITYKSTSTPPHLSSPWEGLPDAPNPPLNPPPNQWQPWSV